jgi:hypothetical protein
LHLSCGCSGFCSRWLTSCSLFLIGSGFSPFTFGRIAAVISTFTCYARTLEWSFMTTWSLLCLQNRLEIRDSASRKVILSGLLNLHPIVHEDIQRVITAFLLFSPRPWALNLIGLQTLIYVVYVVLNDIAWPQCTRHMSCGCIWFCSRWQTFRPLLLVDSGFSPINSGITMAVILTLACYGNILE